MSSSQFDAVLRRLFADYRAEWPQRLFESHFVPPPYFEKLVTNRPCLLIGGRGTGKTIALKSLRFDAAHTRLRAAESWVEMDYYAIYIRINKNRVRAFGGPELDRSGWQKLFAHYFNLQACLEFCRLTEWLIAQRVNPEARIDFARVANCFGLDAVSNCGELERALRGCVSGLELYVNNPNQVPRPLLSIPEAPLRAFSEALLEAGMVEDKLIFCCIDEYENLSEDQQSVLNTYLKHSEPPLSYKIGLRRNGLYTTSTIDRKDQIATPDDYLKIDIAEEGFESFARHVVELRLRLAKQQGVDIETDLERFLPELSFDEEARLLGCSRIAARVREKLKGKVSTEVVVWASSVPDSRLYFLEYWQASSGHDLCELAVDWKDNPKDWTGRLNNHGYASLFWLSRGRHGARVRKYYSGARVLLGLASGNIRYFLELIDESIARQLASEENRVPLSINPIAQTVAARAVGKRRLEQIDGLSERGIELKRLVLAIGKVFFELARDPAGRAPEQNLFVLSGTPPAKEKIVALLNDGVAHLAFEATPRTKATTLLEIRDDEYRLHPIFCPFFEYSHRRKRRVTFSADTLLALETDPSRAIGDLLEKRAQTEEDDLPSQLAMFASFYEASGRDDPGQDK